LDRVEADTYEPRFLTKWAAEIKETRQAILKTTIAGFNPDLMIVDKRPSGVDGELRETLEEVRRSGRQTRLVLGVRDILDEPKSTRQSLKRTHAFEIIDRYYDEVWIYGAREIFDHLKEYRYPPAVVAKSIYCGYLQRPTAIADRQGDTPTILVTTGGGGDGTLMLEAYLEGLLDLPRRKSLRSTVIFGPEMPTERQQALLERYGHLSDVTYQEFTPDLTPYYAAADLVVSMAGYNTVCELLSFGKKAILVPRAKPVSEQLVRARRFAKLGYFDYVEPEQLTPSLLLSKVLTALQAAPPQPPAIDLGGLTRIGARVHALLAEKAK
jgi:predicted glycosyltransferase